MRLFIAEKPSVAKALATQLGNYEHDDGYITAGETTITWCFGHMLEQAEPDEYTPDDVPKNKNGKKIWRVDELPILPREWILKPKDSAKKQLKVIGKLIKKATDIVNAGDPDREGQLLIDEVLEHFDNDKPVLRFWVSAQDSTSIQRGLDNLKSNDEYTGFSNAAKGRQQADWLIGMNLSRAFSLRAQRGGGSTTLLTVGRVQTPTLQMVVTRDRLIENFVSHPYYKLILTAKHENGTFTANWKPSVDQLGLDDEERLIDKMIADQITALINRKNGTITHYEQTEKEQKQPLAFSLSNITALSSSKYGYSAEQVLTVCQALYEKHKLTSYPRTDCSYLPESQHSDAKNIIAALSENFPTMQTEIDNADITIISKTWNDKKVTAHHGIIPTQTTIDLSELTAEEKSIYELIVRSYLAQFYPVHKYLQTKIAVSVENEVFTATGRVVTQNGWKDVYQQQDNNEDNYESLPTVKENDAILVENITCQEAMTKPPAYYTEGTLIKAMENIHKVVEDPKIKKLLRDGDGIGTSATRASIISELKRRDFLTTQKKKIVSTSTGREIVDALPEMVTSPILTAVYERVLQEIEDGTATLENFILKQEAFIREQVEKANSGAVTIGEKKEKPAISSKHKCMLCGAGLSRRPSRKKGIFWWGCSNFPTCKQTYPDNKGKPNYQTTKKVTSS